MNSTSLPEIIENHHWDVAVVGAGPAGSLAAYGLARRGFSVLLMDRAGFPRPKVCGCCLNPETQAILKRVGLGDVLSRCNAVPLRFLQLAAPRRDARLPLSGWHAVSRECLDHRLVESAQKAGAKFLPDSSVRLGRVTANVRGCLVRQPSKEMEITASVVLAADGLGGRLLPRDPDSQIRVSAVGRIGAGVTLADDSSDFEPHQIYMACGSHGYVGLVRLEDRRLNIAAAFDANFVRMCGGPGKSAAHILAEVGWPAVPHLADHHWHGTPPLVRTLRNPFAHRLLALGDAAGYVEPFTGEGIASALISAEAVDDLLGDGWHSRVGPAWAGWLRHIHSKRQRLIRGVAWSQRHPWICRTAIGLAGCIPRITGRVISRVFKPAPRVPPPRSFPVRSPALRREPPHFVASIDQG